MSMQIKIDQQFSQIGIRGNQPARMQITKPQGQMSISDNKTQLQIESQMPTFRVPRERLRSEMGLAGPVSFAKAFGRKGRSAAHRATATYAAEGDQIANKNIPGDKSIPRMVANKMRSYFRKPETNVGLMPSSPPSLDWTKGHFQISASRHNISVDWSGKNLADISVNQNYPVEVFLSRQPYFRIASVEPAVENRTMGRYVDRTV